MTDQDAAVLRDLLFGIRRSVRYHMHRQAFFDRVHDLGALTTAIAGSATVATLLSDESAWSTALAILTAVFSATKASRQNNVAIIRDWCYPRIQYWRGRPLVSLEVVVNLIGHTTTRSGLAIRSELDANNYPTGQPVTAQQMESISLKRDKFHGDWNYSLAPK